MRYVREQLPKRLGAHLHFDIITGTSVGALNGSFLAATALDEDNQAERLAQAWRELHLEQLIALSPRDIFKAGRLLLGKAPPPPGPKEYRYGGILNTDGLEKFVFGFIPWRGIRKSIRAGAVKSLAVSATHVGTGHTVVFLDAAEPPVAWSHNPYVRVAPVAISPRHALASAAIPVLFPAVKVGRAFYVDGSLRNNTPMSPAIHLGADKMLVISLRHKASEAEEKIRTVEREASYPKPLFLLGKALNALLLDPTESDLKRMERINSILSSGEQAYGSEFAKVIASKDRKEAPLRRLEAVHIQPSEDIGAMAAALLARGGPKLSSRVTRNLLHRMAGNEAAGEADMLSYLLFDGDFAADLMDLGYQDAKAQEDELLKVFAPTTGL